MIHIFLFVSKLFGSIFNSRLVNWFAFLGHHRKISLFLKNKKIIKERKKKEIFLCVLFSLVWF